MDIGPYRLIRTLPVAPVVSLSVFFLLAILCVLCVSRLRFRAFQDLRFSPSPKVEFFVHHTESRLESATCSPTDGHRYGRASQSPQAQSQGRPCAVWMLAQPGQPRCGEYDGFDWVLIDTEHAPAELHMVHHQIHAAAAYPSPIVVRAAWNDTVVIKRLLDLGVQTLLLPYVQNAEEAKRAVAAVRYPPRGHPRRIREQPLQPVRARAGLFQARRRRGLPHRADRNACCDCADRGHRRRRRDRRIIHWTADLRRRHRSARQSRTSGSAGRHRRRDGT